MPQWDRKDVQKSSARNYNKLLTMKTTTNTGKIQRCIGKVLEESVEAIWTISVSLKTLSMIPWTSSLNLPELTFLGQS